MEGMHKDHWIQLLNPCKTVKISTTLLKASSGGNSDKFCAAFPSLESLLLPTPCQWRTLSKPQSEYPLPASFHFLVPWSPERGEQLLHSHLPYWGYSRLRCVALHLVLMKHINFLWALFWSLSLSFLSSAKFLQLHWILLSMSLKQLLNSTGPSTDPCLSPISIGNLQKQIPCALFKVVP